MMYTFNNNVPAEQVQEYTQAFAESEKKPVELTFSAGGIEMKVTVRPVLDLNTFASAVESAVSSCFDGADKYVPWMRDIAIMHAAVAAYSNVELPTDLHDDFELLSVTDVFDHVVGAVDPFQYKMFGRAVERKIQYILDEQNSSREQELDRALAMLNFITQKYNEIGVIFNEIMGDEMQQLMEKLRDHATDVTEEVAAIKEKLGLEEIEEDKPPADEGGEV